MADVQIAVIDQQNTQIAVIDQQNTQIVLSAPAETQVTIAVPGIQGPVGLTGDVELAQDGTASLPGIRFESDTNTGIYRAGTDQLAFATNGIGRVFISSAGNVGINNNSPATALDVSGTATASTFIGNLTGNVTGNLTGTASAIADNTVTSAKIVDGSIVDADINASAAIADTKLATISTAGKVSNSATTATSANTASAIVARDASNNFSAGTITANLTGNVTGNLTGIASNVTTNANLTGDVTSVGNATSIAAGVIVDADVNASAAIVGTKISPNFGSQTITTTGVISAAAGAAATPSIAFTGDTNTGIYSPGADQVAISTNGTGRLFINSSGSVGIGGIPTSAFSVTGGNVEISNATYNYYQVSATSGATGQFSANGNTSVELRAITNHPLAFYTNNTERLRITNAGLVGIGTSSPVYPLSVQGPGATPGRVYLGNTLEALASGANSGGAIYFGIDPTSATAPTAGIEASWGGVTTPQIHMGVMRDGNKGRISVLYDGSTRIYTATSERVRVDPTGTFNISCNSATAGFISSIGGSEVARIDSSGRLLMGTSSAFAIQGFSRSHYFAPIANEVNNQMVVAGVSTGTPALFFTRTRGGTPTTYTVVQDGDSLGLLEFYGADGISYGSSGARIQAFVDGTPGVNDMPGRLVFSTTADGASTPTERMRITSAGNVGINTTSFGTSAVAVLALGNGTEPTTGPADSVQIYSVDSSAGNTTLGIRTEGNAVATETVTSNRTFLIRINGTTYKLLLATV